jgi:quinoprotein glucose dehydrogenase
VRRTALIALLLGALAGVAPALAQEAEPYVAGLQGPTNMAFAPDGRLFFVEQATGHVRVVNAGGTLADEPFASFPVGPGPETGLLGIALHPRFEDGEPWVYLYLTDPGPGMNAVVRVGAAGNKAQGEPERLLETVPGTNAYHNGGDLLFGSDDNLYVTVGDAHESGRAQDLADLGGKVLRLTDTGAPAPGNPFGDDNAAFTLGHRNAFGICEDAGGTPWITENGPDRDDEVNRLEAGGNYGWPEALGDEGDEPFIRPIAVWEDPVAVTGCAWWEGDLFAGAHNDGRVYRVDPASGETQIFARFGAGVTDLQVGPDGWLYVSTDDAIWRLAPGARPADGPGEPIDDAGIPARTWVAVGAALVLAVALVVRVIAGRRLRDDGAPEP